MNWFSYTFISVLILYLMWELFLNFRQQRHIRQHRKSVPEAFSDNISLDEHQKAAAYSIDKLKLSRVELIFSAIILLWLTLGGWINGIDQFWQGFGWSAIITGILVIFSVSLLTTLLNLPFSLIMTFVIESQYGFNRTTAKLFISDMFKGMLVSVILGAPLIALVLWLMNTSGDWWWLWVWAVWFGFSLAMMWLYPVVIAPLFNKFTPLDHPELVKRIDALLHRTGFVSNGIFIMDGSKRSGHGNAYFTGFGKAKRIVFFDTLLESLTAPQIESVLAHELGHFYHHHIKKNLVVMAALSLLALAILGYLIQQPWFFEGLGTEPSSYIALILFFIVAPVFSFFITPIMSWFSRKHEYQADSFAVAHASGEELVNALVALYKDNASTLTPDPLYSLVFDSHPPAPLRIAHINQESLS
jgi:STE24 endopeptidase